MTPSFVALAPARRASTRLPGKMLADLGGAPLIVRVLERAAASGAARVAAATDDDDIAAAVRAAGFEAVKTGAHDSGTARVCAAAEILGLGDGDIVVNLQGDEPFMEPEHLSALAGLLAERNPVCATLARPLRDWREFCDAGAVKAVADDAGYALYFSRAPIPFPRDGHERREVPAAALAHLGAYAYRVAALREFAAAPPSALEEIERLEQLRILQRGGRVALLTVASRGFGVDTREDLDRARARWRREHPPAPEGGNNSPGRNNGGPPETKAPGGP